MPSWLSQQGCRFADSNSALWAHGQAARNASCIDVTPEMPEMPVPLIAARNACSIDVTPEMPVALMSRLGCVYVKRCRVRRCSRMWFWCKFARERHLHTAALKPDFPGLRVCFGWVWPGCMCAGLAACSRMATPPGAVCRRRYMHSSACVRAYACPCATDLQRFNKQGVRSRHSQTSAPPESGSDSYSERTHEGYSVLSTARGDLRASWALS
eukprot:92606-Chlamydomonas_euryale.AAC.3